MGRALYQYYLCEDPSLGADILRAAINADAENYRLDVYGLSDTGQLHCRSASASLKTRRRHIPGAPYGFSAALGALVACVLFLPILFSVGQTAFASLVFLSAMIGAWAGGAFSRATEPMKLKRGIKKLNRGELLIVVHSDAHSQDLIQQALARYSNVLPVKIRPQAEADTA